MSMGLIDHPLTSKILAWLEAVNRRAAYYDIANVRYEIEARDALNAALAAQPAFPLRGREPTQKQIDEAILKFAREHMQVSCLTYDSGAYEITTPTHYAQAFARAILAIASPPEQPAAGTGARANDPGCCMGLAPEEACDCAKSEQPKD